MQVPFGEWLPDQPDHNKQGANVATNVYHAANTYKRFPSLVAYSTNNIGKNAKGAGSFRDNSNNIYKSAYKYSRMKIIEQIGGIKKFTYKINYKNIIN